MRFTAMCFWVWVFVKLFVCAKVGVFTYKIPLSHAYRININRVIRKCGSFNKNISFVLSLSNVLYLLFTKATSLNMAFYIHL